MNEMIQSLKTLVSFESVFSDDGQEHPYGKETDAATNYLLDLAKGFGFKTCKKNGYAYVEIGEGKNLIGILSHIDVVPSGEGWDHDPFGLELLDDKLYGRGTIDDKGPTIAALYAMKDVLDEGNPSKRVRLIIGQSEENGEWDDIDSYIKNEELPDYGFTPDGDFPAIISEKGCLLLKVSMPILDSGIEFAKGGIASNMVPSEATIRASSKEFSGKGVATHGCAPWLGKNAIGDAVRNAAQALGLEGSRFLKMYMSLLCDSIYGEKLGIDANDDFAGKLTMNVGKINTNGSNIELDVDIRYPGIKNEDEILKKARPAFESFGASCERIYGLEPIYVDPKSKLTEALLSAYQDVTGDLSEPVSIGGTTYAKSMKNIVAFGPNFPGHENREHRENEYILLEDFENLRNIYRKAIENLIKI